MRNETKKILEQIKNSCDDYYPTLAGGCVVLNLLQGSSDIEDIINTFNTTEEVAEELIDSGLVEFDNYDTVNPENEDRMLYLRIIKIKGNETYYTE